MRFPEHPRNSKGYAAATQEIQAEIHRLWKWLGEMHELGRPRRATPPRREKVPEGVVPLQAIHAYSCAAITLRQNPPSPLPRLPALPSVECGFWLGARNAEVRRNHQEWH